jgi:hypothetical protein
MFATRSAREFPTAKMVKPMIASDNPKIKPKVCGDNYFRVYLFDYDGHAPAER